MLSLCLLATATFARADERADLFAALDRAKVTERSDFAAAARNYEAALVLAPRVFGESHKNTATILNNLANMYKELAQYEKAEEFHLRGLKIREAVLAANDPDIAQSVGNMANLYLAMGRYAKAESFYLRSLKIREARLGPNDLEVAETLNNLGALYNATGQFAQSEPVLQRSLRIRQARLGPDHPIVATSVNNLGTLYMDLGQFDKSEQYLQQALKSYEISRMPNQLDVSLVVNNLAILYSRMGQLDKAETMLQRSLQLKEAKSGLDHPDVALALNNLAVLYKQKFQYDKAESLYLRSLSIREAKLGAEHPEVSSSLNNLANVYQEQGRYVEAEKLYQRSLGILEAKFGKQHPDLARSAVYNLALMHAAQDQIAQAADEFDRARRIVRRHTALVLPILSEQEQLKFLENIDRRNYFTALTLGWKKGDDAAIAARSASWLANGKGVVQECLVQRATMGRDSTNPQFTAIVNKLLAVRRELANLINKIPKPSEEAQHRADLARLPEQEQELAKQLVRAGGTHVPSAWVELDSIRKALPPKGILIDICRFEPTVFAAKAGETFRLPPRYAAWLTPPEGPDHVQVVDLGEADKIEAALNAFRAAFKPCQSPDQEQNPILALGEPDAEKNLRKTLTELSTLVLKPLLPYLNDRDELIISPDSGLWLMPWAALPLADDRYAIERWNIHYVTSARDLISANEARPKPGTGPRMFANPDYDLPAQDVVSELNSVFGGSGKLLPPPSRASIVLPDVENVSRGVQTIGRVPHLPGTASEARAITPSLTKYAGEPKLYTERQALEGVFKRLSSPKILVLSTHGFFLDEPTANRENNATIQSDNRPLFANEQATANRENPLLRCGLLLAGCNNRGQLTAENVDDGVLTGLEIVGTDLRATELVVLSACETGLGKVNNGEGVAGLRQAFQLAGARSVVATLWKIPDKQSAQLMNDFFTNLAAGQSKSAALRNAQLAMIKARREKFNAAHPFFWAAFTLTGE